MSEQKPLEPSDGLRTWWSWHRSPQFWHDAYRDLLANSATAFVVYAIAALAGFVSAKPLTIVGVIILIGTVPIFLVALVQTVRHWRGVRPLFITWSTDPSPQAEHYRRIYVRLTMSLFLGVFPGAALVVFGAVAK